MKRLNTRHTNIRLCVLQRAAKTAATMAACAGVQNTSIVHDESPTSEGTCMWGRGKRIWGGGEGRIEGRAKVEKMSTCKRCRKETEGNIRDVKGKTRTI